VRLLTRDAVVLYVTMFLDGDGMQYVPREVLRQIAAASAAPVFGVFETYLGHGIAAGSIESYGEQGRRTGELVARVLNGEEPSTIGVQPPVDATYLADFRQLRHWGIAENLMPEGSEVRYKEVTTWERYRWQILTALSVILVQAVLIGVLMIHRRRLHQTQYELHDEYERRRKAETAVLRVRTKLSRFSKQSSLGVMATAIAHEINQPLIAVQNYVLAARQRLRGDVDQSAKLEELLEKAGQQAGRVGEIIQRIRNLVTRDTPNLRPVLLISVIEQAIRIMEAEIENSGCEVKFRLPENLPPILADELQIQLVLINLLRNALRAVKNLEDSAERIIRIQVSRMSDRNVQVDVVDRGPGVAPARVAEIFAPLYTEMGDGMGMGLAVCQLVIEAHGGRIWYEPNPSGGAILSFTLRVEKGGQG